VAAATARQAVRTCSSVRSGWRRPGAAATCLGEGEGAAVITGYPLAALPKAVKVAGVSIRQSWLPLASNQTRPSR